MSQENVEIVRGAFATAASFSSVETSATSNVNLPRPQLTRHLRERPNGTLGKVLIPLGPSVLLALGQVEGIHHGAALPTVVRGCVALGHRGRSWVCVLDPASAHGDRCDVERHVSLRLGPRCQRSDALPSDSRLLRCGRSACRHRAREPAY
jgi:hypothetical protein